MGASKTKTTSDRAAQGHWLVLFHQIPPKPDYLRVKIGRRLARIGAVALKNTVYVLPPNDGTIEDFQWVLREVVAAGGDATLVRAHLMEGLSDAQVEAMFRSARDADYAAVLEDGRALERALITAHGGDEVRALEGELARLERRMEEIATIDFFEAPGRRKAAAFIGSARERLRQQSADCVLAPAERRSYRGRVWVTRAGIHVDRIASAWLVRRFIDTDAVFKFAPAKGYKPGEQELRFDMYEAEFSHEGDMCTFEVLCRRFALADRGLHSIAEVIHDIDLKDSKYGRPETSGITAQITGLTLAHHKDEARLERGCELFDQLFAYFSRRPP